MGNDSSEEKTLPPSRQKLRKARQKGQVVTSKETLASVSMTIVLIYLLMQYDAISADLRLLFVLEPTPGADLAGALAEKARISLHLVIRIVAPILIGVITVAVLGSLLISGGPVFSAHPLIPDFNKVNPGGGLKRIFGRRAMMNFLMHVIRLTALLVVPAMILWANFGALIAAPLCGLGCINSSAKALLAAVLTAVLALLVLAALLDYLVQRSEFMREQRMSITEFKREMKDQDGDPQLKGQLRQDQRAMVDRPTGLLQATVIIYTVNAATGLRYVENETPAPLVVIRARGPEAVARLLSAAKHQRIAESQAAIDAIASVPVGDYVVADDQIQAIAPFLHQI